MYLEVVTNTKIGNDFNWMKTYTPFEHDVDAVKISSILVLTIKISA